MDKNDLINDVLKVISLVLENLFPRAQKDIVWEGNRLRHGEWVYTLDSSLDYTDPDTLTAVLTEIVFSLMSHTAPAVIANHASALIFRLRKEDLERSHKAMERKLQLKAQEQLKSKLT